MAAEPAGADSSELLGPAFFGENQARYREYVETIFENHGTKGTKLRFACSELYYKVKIGMEGVVVDYESLDSVLVDWGDFRRYVSLGQCILLETADGKKRLRERLITPTASNPNDSSAQVVSAPGLGIPPTVTEWERNFLQTHPFPLKTTPSTDTTCSGVVGGFAGSELMSSSFAKQIVSSGLSAVTEQVEKTPDPCRTDVEPGKTAEVQSERPSVTISASIRPRATDQKNEMPSPPSEPHSDTTVPSPPAPPTSPRASPKRPDTKSDCSSKKGNVDEKLNTEAKNMESAKKTEKTKDVGSNAKIAQREIFSVGAMVRYWSSTHGKWLDCYVQRVTRDATGAVKTYDLTVKAEAPLSRVKPASCQSDAPPQEEKVAALVSPPHSADSIPIKIGSQVQYWCETQSHWSDDIVVSFHKRGAQTIYDLKTVKGIESSKVRLSVNAFCVDESVEYWSASVGRWLPARVLRIHAAAQGTMDLDLKPGAPVDRLRKWTELLPNASTTSNASNFPNVGLPDANRAASGGAVNVPPPPFTCGFEIGDQVQYWSETKGRWIETVVEALGVKTGSVVYDLSCKHGIPADKVRPSLATSAQKRYKVGDRVEYWSTSAGRWLPAKVLAVKAKWGLCDLDVKQGALFGRLRRNATSGKKTKRNQRMSSSQAAIQSQKRKFQPPPKNGDKSASSKKTCRVSGDLKMSEKQKGLVEVEPLPPMPTLRPISTGTGKVSGTKLETNTSSRSRGESRHGLKDVLELPPLPPLPGLPPLPPLPTRVSTSSLKDIPVKGSSKNICSTTVATKKLMSAGTASGIIKKSPTPSATASKAFSVVGSRQDRAQAKSKTSNNAGPKNALQSAANVPSAKTSKSTRASPAPPSKKIKSSGREPSSRSFSSRSEDEAPIRENRRRGINKRSRSRRWSQTRSRKQSRGRERRK